MLDALAAEDTIAWPMRKNSTDRHSIAMARMMTKTLNSSRPSILLRQFSQRLLPVGAAVAFCIVSRTVFSAPAAYPNPSAPPAEKPAPDKATKIDSQAIVSPNAAPTPDATKSYIGTNQCFQCHRPQTNAWSETKHAHAFTDVPKKYQNDSSCLKCHVTGFGQSSGFVAGSDKDLLMVGCEACHGPGAAHVDAAKRFVLADPGEEAKIEKEMKETITKTPSDKVCSSCHIQASSWAASCIRRPACSSGCPWFCRSMLSCDTASAQLGGNGSGNVFVAV